MPSEHPILFSGPMVRAIGEGRKTQTRRVCKMPIRVRLPQPVCGDGPFFETVARAGVHPAHLNPYGAVSVAAGNGKRLGVKPNEFEWCCPYGVPGDRLWVRETWAIPSSEPLRGRTVPLADVRYAADSLSVDIENPAIRWRPSIHMPRWASRYTLEVTDVRVERVQEISVEDAIAELGGRAAGIVNEQGHFHELWDNINAKRGHTWAANDWVWAITFKLVEAKP